MDQTPEKRTLYVGCGLTGTPESFQAEVETVKSRLRTDWQVSEFLGLAAGTNADVYRTDIEHNIKRCDAFLAIADYPANGLGWELGVADERGIPTLIVARQGIAVSRLLLGASEVRPHIDFRHYNLIDDIAPLARAILKPFDK